MKLTFDNFVSHLIFHPFKAETKKERSVALVASIACAVFLVGLVHLACAIRNRFFRQLSSQPSNLTTNVSQNVDSVFWKNITPKNIDTILRTNWTDKESRESAKDGLFSIQKNIVDNVTHYDCSVFHKTVTKETFECLSFYRYSRGCLGNVFCVDGDRFRTSDELIIHPIVGNYETQHHYFNNLDEVFKLVFNGHHYKMSGHDAITLLKADNSEVVYKKSMAL